MRNFIPAPRLFLFGAILFGLCASPVAGVSKKKKEKKNAADWEILFDGNSTEKWRGYKKTDFPSANWKVEDGVLKTNPNAQPIDLVSKEEYGDFDLRVEWKVTPGANSGIIYRANEEGEEAWQTGPEMQILDDDKHADGKNPKTTAGALYALIAPTNKTLKPVGKWNKVRVIARGNHIEHWLNGKKVVEYDMNSPELQALIKESKFAPFLKFAKLPSGHVVLQHHQDEVWFRDIKIRRLKGQEGKE
jgi:hypothetical protein